MSGKEGGKGIARKEVDEKERKRNSLK